ncbi:MAG TPA: cytochrome ubiquinol oxidase subunit I [Leeuwenhoekiella sp.]|nr:cytochrome ubiquinol oxidase subunit I [Leeuwenhoekiella sp.]
MVQFRRINKTNNEIYKDLAKSWSKGVAIFFAVGAVSGTFLSFELGLLWPTFMLHAGPIFGMPFSLEGTAFFIEAIALGVFLYGWDKIPRWAHWWSGIVVGVSGVISGIFVVAANSWMNSPSGFDYVNGRFINIDPIAALFNDAWFSQALHMTIAAFASTGFAVAGLHAILLIRGHKLEFHRKALQIVIVFAAIAALLMPITGDIAAKGVAERQPAKLAAMDLNFKTQTNAPLTIGGLPNEEKQEAEYAIHIPGALSFLAHGDFDAEVIGLDQIPKDEQPPLAVTHIAFQIMVGLGFLMMAIGLINLYLNYKKKNYSNNKGWLWLTALATPIGFIALEAGWTVTEVGRQPWIIYKIMRTEDALTPMPGISYSLVLVLIIYSSLTAAVIWLMNRQIKKVHKKYNPE